MDPNRRLAVVLVIVGAVLVVAGASILIGSYNVVTGVHPAGLPCLTIGTAAFAVGGEGLIR